MDILKNRFPIVLSIVGLLIFVLVLGGVTISYQLLQSGPDSNIPKNEISANATPVENLPDGYSRQNVDIHKILNRHSTTLEATSYEYIDKKYYYSNETMVRTEITYNMSEYGVGNTTVKSGDNNNEVRQIYTTDRQYYYNFWLDNSSLTVTQKNNLGNGIRIIERNLLSQDKLSKANISLVDSNSKRNELNVYKFQYKRVTAERIYSGKFTVNENNRITTFNSTVKNNRGHTLYTQSFTTTYISNKNIQQPEWLN